MTKKEDIEHIEKLEEIVDKLVDVADQKKAEHIVVYNVTQYASLTDFVIVVSTKNVIQGRAILIEIEKKVKELLENEDSDDIFEPKISGKTESEWVVLDINSIVIHIISEAKRNFYGLDELFEQKAIVYHQ